MNRLSSVDCFLLGGEADVLAHEHDFGLCEPELAPGGLQTIPLLILVVFVLHSYSLM